MTGPGAAPLVRRRVLSEVCVDSVAGARAAWQGGADRIELCAALEIGGLTASLGLLDRVLTSTELPVHALIRPRQGDFCYDDGEIAAMCADLAMAVAHGCAGVVVGALTRDGSIDAGVTARLRDAAAGAPVTFHRAFDLVDDQLEALDTVRDLGLARVLTSGGRRSAAAGVRRLAELVHHAEDAVVIMAGAGITPTNVAGVVRDSGVREIHFSARRQVETPRYRNPDVVLGTGETARGVTSSGIVGATVGAVADL